ncbi:zona pellucida sperm-binding protein 4-like [Neopsephotus bourkii]|uniref:zona pellucida sperm-binding protein 4-like n=1 Tax=Neopsephotus bourkii TaxID=309878 RepID=UPI002AA529B3|nr:zona pellucida sperm-binding protein 4-like [Neopsephotus bourkii]
MGVVGQSRTAFGAMLFLGFLGLLFLVMGAQGSVFSDPSLLACGQETMQLTLSLGWQGNTTFVLIAWDVEGKAHALQNDSECGLLVFGTLDGSQTVMISYAGCYVFEWDGHYLMLVGLEGSDAAGQKVLHEEKLLRCPVDLPALDAPSSSVCSAILSQDRLLCASLPINQGDCEVRGCCYDPRDRVMPCYFGNKGTAFTTGHWPQALQTYSAVEQQM